MLLSRSIVINEATISASGYPCLVVGVRCLGGKFGVCASHPAGAHVSVFRVNALASGPA